MEPIYSFLGMTVGVVTNGLGPHERQQAYSADITYGTNNEFGFDYLRDNMALTFQDKVQRPLHFSIVDEVDSILIDEARTPLIISGAVGESSELYHCINRLVPQLAQQTTEDSVGDYTLDEKARQVFLTESGQQKVEQLLEKAGLLNENESLYSSAHIGLLHYVNAALRAHGLYQRDVDYLVKEGQVVIVDEHTGRMMPGRRWGEGLHQAIEAKENVRIEKENQTLASITFQNYFRLYEKLSGMTGTADTEAYEFQQIYGLEVVVIPTNKAMIREDFPDVIYLHVSDKYEAIVKEIKVMIEVNRPVLVGTASIESSEHLSRLLKREKIQHQVLNAKFHEQEAKIIAEAGCPGAVTIATNMAGRGTDIVLGGNLNAQLAQVTCEEEKAAISKTWQVHHDQIIAAGGLHILGTERHESRRIDNQLRGRAGRQGDPGSSRFYLSLEDNLIRIFASDRAAMLLQRFGMQAGEALESSLLSRAIENAQRKVESHNFDIRKQLLEYDNVANEQRKVIYQQRSEILEAKDIAGSVIGMQQDVLELVVRRYIPFQSVVDQWDIEGLKQQLRSDFGLDVPLDTWIHEENDEVVIFQKLQEAMQSVYQKKETLVGSPMMRQFEKSIVLQVLDNHWKDHLAAMDYLRQGIHLRGYAQKNPKQEYKREAFELFAQMLDAFKLEVVGILSCVEVSEQDPIEQATTASIEPIHSNYHAFEPAAVTYQVGDGDEEAGDVITLTREKSKVGHNQLCPCGSKKKYKHCCAK